MSFDQEPCPDSRIEDSATDLFRFGYPERAGLENQGDVETQLASLRFFDSGHQMVTWGLPAIFPAGGPFAGRASRRRIVATYRP